MPTAAQIQSVLAIQTVASLITGAATITDVSNYSSIGVGSGSTVKILLYITDPTGESVYKNTGYDAANFASPDLEPLSGDTTFNFNLAQYTTDAYITGQYGVNIKIQVTQGSDITETYKILYANVCACCNNIVPDVQGDVSYNTAIVSVIDYTNYKTWTALTNVLTLTPPAGTGSAQTGTFGGTPAKLVFEPPTGQFPFTGVWQWGLQSDVTYTDATTGTSTTCRLIAAGRFEVVQSQLCKVRCLLDKYRTQVYAALAKKQNDQLQTTYLMAEADYLMAFASERCALPQTTIDKYIANIYLITGIDPDCECGCGDGTSQPLVPTSSVNGTNGTNGSQILYGSGAPSNGAGAVNDTYINTANGDMYKKTGASTWTFQLNIKGAAGATGASGAVVLYNNFANKATETSGSFETIDEFEVPLNTLTTDGDELVTSFVYNNTADTIDPQQNVRILFAGTSLSDGIPISFSGGITKIVIAARIVRTSNTTANVQLKATLIMGIEEQNSLFLPLQPIASLNFTTTAYTIAQQAYDLVVGDIVSESMEVIYNHKS